MIEKRNVDHSARGNQLWWTVLECPEGTHNEQGNSEAAIARLCTTTEGASLKRRDTLAESVGRLCQHQKRCRCCSAGLVARVTGCFG